MNEGIEILWLDNLTKEVSVFMITFRVNKKLKIETRISVNVG